MGIGAAWDTIPQQAMMNIQAGSPEWSLSVRVIRLTPFLLSLYQCRLCGARYMHVSPVSAFNRLSHLHVGVAVYSFAVVGSVTRRPLTAYCLGLQILMIIAASLLTFVAHQQFL